MPARRPQPPTAAQPQTAQLEQQPQQDPAAVVGPGATTQAAAASPPQQQPAEQYIEDQLGQQQQQAFAEAAPGPAVGIRGRNVTLTNAHRKKICEKRYAHPAITLDALGTWAQQEFSLSRKPAMGTLSRILNKQSKYRNMSDSELQSQRTRDVLCAELDGALTAWIRENQERNLHVSYKMIIGKAKELAAYIRTLPGKGGAEMPAFSNGWVSGFTKRNMFIGPYLNAPGVSSAAAAAVAAGSPVSGADGASAAGPDIRPFSTNEQLVLRAIATQQAKANRELNTEMDHDMEDDGDEDMGSTSMEDIVSDMQTDMQTDLHHQVVHAVARDISPAVATTSTPSAATAAIPAKKPRVRRPRSTAPQQRDSNKSTTQQVQEQEQHQTHQATAGLVPASATDDMAADLGSVTPPAITPFNIATTTPATPSAPTSTTRPTPSTTEALAAVRIVIESLNVHIPSEADLLRPLFDMERRLYNQINTERPNTLLNWSK